MNPMESSNTVTLKRDCEAIQIPYGQKMVLPQGTQVKITQSLGGTFTVITDQGYMVRVDGKDADALGIESPQISSPLQAALEKDVPVEKLVWDQMRTCYDPEIPVNIADLGLIYECKITEIAEGAKRVDVKMTLTAPGCGMGDSLRADVHSKILRVPGVKEANVELVWEPHWDQSRMSEAARLQLGLL